MSEKSARKVLIAPELMEQWATRDTDGNLLTWEWGEPDADGFYCPAVSVNYDNNLAKDFKAENAALRRILSECRKAIANLEPEALGITPHQLYYGYCRPIRDELLGQIEAFLED